MSKKIVRLTEKELKNIIKKVVVEQMNSQSVSKQVTKDSTDEPTDEQEVEQTVDDPDIVGFTTYDPLEDNRTYTLRKRPIST